MKKLMGIFILVIFLLSLSFVIAGGNFTKECYKKSGVSKTKWYAVKIVGFALASFVFSLIFWWTKGLVEKKTRKRRK
tara:strand:+ start:612 stop:842 length:231 start_codon:yes stop_codon:yes gene_type:complete